MSVAAPRSVLVHRRGGLGDTLLVLPLLRCLRRRWPAARLALAGVADYASVLRSGGACDEALASDDVHLWAAGLDTEAGERARRALARFDLLLVDTPLTPWPGGPGVRVFDSRRVADGAPFAEQLAHQLGEQPRWPADALLRPQDAGGAGLVLAPGSGGRAKCWPRAHWLTLAAALAPAPLRVVVGPAEQERDDPSRWPWPRAVASVVEPSVAGLARELARAAAFVGNDSGTTHLAAVLGVPTVAIFGPTDPAVWAPVGPHVRVVAGGPDFAAAGVDAVLAALRSLRHAP